MRFACRNKEELQLYAYGFLEGPEAAVVESHLQGCAECREELDRLVGERQIVAFELSLDPGVSEAEPVVPAPLPAPEAPGRRLRLPRAVVPALIAAAAVVLVLAALSALFSVDPVEPDRTVWTRLPDGSRYHAVEGATVREGRRFRSIALDEGALHIDVEPAEKAFTIRTPHGSVSSDGGHLQVSVSDAGTRLEVTDGQAYFTPSSEPPEIRIEGAGEDWGVLRDWNAMLLATVFELEAELARIRAGMAPETGPNPSPEEALNQSVLAALAGDLRELAPYLAAGRLPRDPALLRRLIEHHRRLRTLADALGMDGATVAEIARDPRSGPKLFKTVVAQAWPQASENDLLRLEDGVARALTEYEEVIAAAETPAARAAAEEGLMEDLAREVEDFEEQQGPPTVDPVPEQPTLREAKQPLEAAPVRDEPSEGTDARNPTPAESFDTPAEEPPVGPTGNTGSPTGGTPSTATDILSTAGFSSDNDLVYRGPLDYLVKYVVTDWLRDYSLSRAVKADLKRLALRWVSDYRDRLRVEDRDTVAALEAGLGRGSVPAGVKTSMVLALRQRLLGIQAATEKGLYDFLEQEGLLPAKRPASRPTFFLID